MKGSLFVYSRLEKLDYRLIYAPPKSILSSPFRDDFIDFAREVVNVDNVLNGQINRLRWSLIKRENVVLVGIGCHNRQLGAQNVDFAGREVRGFFGVVINALNNDVINTLCDVKFYRNLYESFISPLWSITDQRKVNSICQEVDIEETVINDIIRVDINIDNSKFKIFPQNTEFKDVLYYAFRQDSVDVVFNLNNLQHITSADLYHFHNVTIIGNNNVELHPFKVQEVESHEQNIEGEKINIRNHDADEGVLNNLEEGEDILKKAIIGLMKMLKLLRVSINDFLIYLADILGYGLIKKTEDDNISSQNEDQNGVENYRSLQNSEYSQSKVNSDLNIVDKKEERRKTIEEIRKEYQQRKNKCKNQSSEPSLDVIMEIVQNNDEEQSNNTEFGGEVEEIL